MATLKGGGIALAAGDVYVANDPETGQGANNAVHCAQTYVDAILGHEGKPYDQDFLQEAAASYWDYAKWATEFTNAFLKHPPPPHVMELLQAGNRHPAIRHRLAGGFANPRDLFDWLMDPAKATAYLARLASTSHCTRA